MNIKRIIVGELPHGCWNCFSRVYNTGEQWCFFKQKRLPTDSYDMLKELNRREDWCPLVVEEVCEWVFRVFDGKDMYNSPESCGYHATYPEFTFCPSCGKRIKYVESEE